MTHHRPPCPEPPLDWGITRLSWLTSDCLPVIPLTPPIPLSPNQFLVPYAVRYMVPLPVAIHLRAIRLSVRPHSHSSPVACQGFASMEQLFRQHAHVVDHLKEVAKVRTEERELPARLQGLHPP